MEITVAEWVGLDNDIHTHLQQQRHEAHEGLRAEKDSVQD